MTTTPVGDTRPALSDLASLEPTAHQGPVAQDLDDATVTGLLTSLFAGTRLLPTDVTSARAAFQDSLYGRTAVIDLRPAAARSVDGDLGVEAVVVDDPREALTVVRRIAETSQVALVSTDGVLAARIAAQLRLMGLTWVDAVDGGFRAWRTAGLPVSA